jgi:hypothetical protein
VTATLTFTLPEEQEEFQCAVDGSEWKSAMDDISNWLRAKLKYEELTPEQDAAYEAARNQLHTIIQERGLSLW